MNQIAIYQHPFVDVFEVTKLTEWKQAHKEGDVKAVHDKAIAKQIVAIGGATPASNYIQVPATKDLPKASLGLIGKYVYCLLNVPAGKTFVMHFDYMINDSRVVRLSLSNIYREFKNMNGTSIQVPLGQELVPNKWTVLVVDALYLFEQNKVFAAGQQPKFFLRSFQICASVQVRGIYTSDLLYTAMTLPKAMKFKAPKGGDWFAEYAWIQIPPQEGSQTVDGSGLNADLGEVKENRESNAQTAKSSLKRAASAGKKVSFTPGVKGAEGEKKAAGARPASAVPRGKGTGKGVKPRTGKAGATKDQPEAAAPDAKKEELSPEELYQEELRQQQAEAQALYEEQQAELLEEKKSGLERTMTEIEQIKADYDCSLQSKNITQKTDVTLYQEGALYDPNKSQRRNSENFILRPDPIMALDRVVGIHPRFSAGQVYFNRDPKLASELLYCQANVMLGYHATLQKQRLFKDKYATAIDQFLVTRHHALTFCKQPISATANRGNKGEEDIMVSIWDLEESSKSIFQFRPPLATLKSASISQDQASLALSGKDFQGRELILVYAFQELVKFQKVELLARQLADIDLVSLKFNEALNTSLVGCGRENIRFYKIKNNFLPSQLVSLNNTARGKIFNNSCVGYKIDEQKGTKKPTHAFVTTECGLLFLVNYFSRQVDKIVQVHDDPVQSIVMAPPKDGEAAPFYLTASRTGTLRIWSPDFSKLVSELSINQEVACCDINVDQKEIAVMAADGTLSLLDLESSSFRVLMRSHQDDIVDIAHNNLTGSLVSIGKDSSVKVWLAETMEQIHEFNTAALDPPTSLASSINDVTVAVGFKSGFLRIFNLKERKMVHETMIFESSVMDIAFSQEGKFMSTFFKNGKIVIFNIENEYSPVKNIDYEFPNGNYFSLSFSPDERLLANISSNANTITVWETKNFSLRWYIDLTGEIISKIAFAPNGKDLLVMTTTSKLKVMRVDQDSGQQELQSVRDQYGITDKECTDFAVAPNGKFLFVAGKENLIRVYDYFLRGQVLASQQAFDGHLAYATKVVLQRDMRNLYSIGPGNGIYKWAFFGDKETPPDLSAQYEKTQVDIAREEQKETEITLPTFDQHQLQTYTEQQLGELRGQLVGDKAQNAHAATASAQVIRPHQDLLQDGGLSLKRAPKVEYTPSGYTFEQHDLALQKVLGCSIAPKVRQNLIWDKKRSYIAYTMQNILIFEELSMLKTQSLKNECNDFIYEIKISPNAALLLAYTKCGTLDGFPQIIVWDAQTRRKVSQIAIDDAEIVCVEFSNASNMLLVVSYNGDDANPRATVAVWDFLDGRKEYLCKSVLPFKILDARWNAYIKTSSDEFVTISSQKYHYWRITQTLHMQFQEGAMPKDVWSGANSGESLTTLAFVEPFKEQNSVYLLLGLSTGHIWVLDTRSNHFMYSSKAIDCAVLKITSSIARIVVEGRSDTKLHCWELAKTIGDLDYDASDPNYFFAGKELQLTLDGYPSASEFDLTAAEGIFISSNGTFWLCNFIEGLTVKLKSCHSPTHPLQAIDYKYVSPSQFQPAQQDAASGYYEFDQNYLVGSSGKDGAVKVWNMYDLEHCLNFIVPKEECLAIAMHQFKPFMVCAYTDGYLRFFDLEECKNLGRCLINSANEEGDPNKPDETKPDPNDYVVQLRILPSGQHILCATKNGQVILIHVECWQPLAITLQNLVSLNTAINAFDVSFLEPYNKWLVATSNGKVMVYNRQDCNSFKQELFDRAKMPTFIYMDSFNVQEYVDNCFTETKKVNSLDHFYSLAKRNLVYNEVSYEHETEAAFLNNDLASYVCYVRKSNNLFIRNFELHQVVKRIQLPALCLQMQIAPGSSPYVFLILDDNSVRMIDFVNEANQSAIKTIHDRVMSLRVCPNGRYVMSAGDKGDVVIYSVRKVQSDMARQMATDAAMTGQFTAAAHSQDDSLSRGL